MPSWLCESVPRACIAMMQDAIHDRAHVKPAEQEKPQHQCHPHHDAAIAAPGQV